MRDNKLHTPDGVKDYLIKEFAFKKEIENRIQNVFHCYSFSSVESPMFEYIDVFTNMGSTNPTQMYKFIDRDGFILTLRPDITPPIARIAATNYKKSELPLRLCYIENAFRYNENYQGKLSEFTQAGVELIGSSSVDASAEVVAVAINSLIASGLTDFRIDLGQVEFFKGLLEESNCSEYEAESIKKLILEKDFATVEEMVKDLEMPKGVKEILSNYVLYTGGLSLLEECEKLVSNQKSLSAIENLKKIYEILKDYRLEKYVSFDLSMIGHLDYYTGIIFRGYAYGTGFSVLDGGRYDSLCSNFGADYPAVGFAIRINDLVTALENQKITITTSSIETLVAYSKNGRDTALYIADELRASGLSIENSLLGEELSENIEYARKRDIKGILYFMDNEIIKLINLETNEERIVTVDEIIKNS